MPSNTSYGRRQCRRHRPAGEYRPILAVPRNPDDIANGASFTDTIVVE
jgi:hypothetical protein